ncbi:protein CLEC16A-like protein [Leptotrombidium deliense]|uniref:Protein CLEC16A-like protein n=1 Tax=Leptotrombidium deliense TaxID=299467 RepID=A0A443SPY5_9ACAR|nr:protein CLEC16A-like protein [Leptotrombidium deliense]
MNFETYDASMFKGKGWFGGWSSKPKNPHSLDHLKYLYNVMSKNQTVNEQNKTLLVETLRSIAEILIWGDQNDSTVFDFFLEKNMLSFFLKIMKQKCGSYVCVQLLQTLNILFENIRNETSLYYLLSNNHFDFSDEEVMAYYISFLKTLSLKLNAHTIHFFFNEHTNDFPLYTEAIKFFNHSEKMVRIAVRTLTLNVFKVDERSMLKFVGDRTAVPYFSNLVWFIGNHVLEIDACLRSPNKDHQMLIRLDDFVAEHLDHLHYLNDILLLHIFDLNQILTDHLLNRLLIPLYIHSLVTPSEKNSPTERRHRISQIVSLFLLSQVFLIISYESLVQRLVNILFNGNMSIFDTPEFAAPQETLEESLVQAAKLNHSEDSQSMSCMDSDVDCSKQSEMEDNAETSSIMNESSITDEEKAKMSNPKSLLDNRPFLDALFEFLDCSNKADDHLAIFSLCLLYAILSNSGVKESQLNELTLIPDDANAEFVDSLGSTKLIDHLTEIMHLSCQYNSRIRLITLEMSVLLLKKLVMRENKSILSDHHLAAVEQAKEEASSVLRNFFKSEEEAIFLDIFEEEYQEMQRRRLNVEYLMMDANLLLPPNNLTPLMMNGLEFTRRLPCADVERTRYAIRVFLLLRQLSLTLRNEAETQLPLTNYDAFVKTEQLLDLNNSDLIACTVITKDQPKMRRFMVIDSQQLILIEPDSRLLGWGVAKFVALLQEIEVNPDKDDSRSLLIAIKQSNPSTANKRVVVSARYVFDDHIRCMAAKQRLTKGRMKARQKKMIQIAKLIDLHTIPDGQSSSRRSGSSSSTAGRDIPRSQSQTEGFGKRHHHNHSGNSHRPLCRGAAVPGSAVADSIRGGPHFKPNTRRRSISSSNPQSTQSRDSSPKPMVATLVVPSEEMIPLEDLSPKSNRRRTRSRSENRGEVKEIKVQDKCDRV